MIILDTNVVSETWRAQIDARVSSWVDAQDTDNLYITSVTLAELLCGAAILPPGLKRETLLRRIETIETVLFADRVLAFDSPSAHHNATINALARRTGKALGYADAQIAAMALAHNCPVATRDTAPFLAAGVEVINPWTAD